MEISKVKSITFNFDELVDLNKVGPFLGNVQLTTEFFDHSESKTYSTIIEYHKTLLKEMKFDIDVLPDDTEDQRLWTFRIPVEELRWYDRLYIYIKNILSKEK